MEKDQPSSTAKIVTFDYADFDKDLSSLNEKIKEAYGPDGVGICVVSGIPQFIELRSQLLHLCEKFATLPSEVLKNYEFPQYHHVVGWSHGKESFRGQPDFVKGSFYANPQYDNIHGDKEIQDGEVFAPNVWPKEVPELEKAFKDLGNLVVQTGLRLAKHIDAYVKSESMTYESGKLYRIIETSLCCKARCLHYFPSHSVEDVKGEMCGWHNDHGALTGLVPAMYFSENGKEVPFFDPESGLFVQSPLGSVQKAMIPKDCLAFQIGETAQILSGGVLRATPHAVVRGKKLIGSGMSRNTFAVFMQPNQDEMMKPPEGVPMEKVYENEKQSSKVPPLQDRWSPTQTFGMFGLKTIQAYQTLMNK